MINKLVWKIFSEEDVVVSKKQGTGVTKEKTVKIGRMSDPDSVMSKFTEMLKKKAAGPAEENPAPTVSTPAPGAGAAPVQAPTPAQVGQAPMQANMLAGIAAQMASVAAQAGVTWLTQKDLEAFLTQQFEAKSNFGSQSLPKR